MPTGKLKIRQKGDGSLSRFIKLSGSKELGIPAKFILTLEMNNLDCEYELEPSGAIAKIIVAGSEVPINTATAEQAEARRLARLKEEEDRKKAEQAQRQQERQPAFNNQRGNQEPEPERVFNIYEFSKLPDDTKQILETTQERIDNLALRLMKGVNFWPDNKNKATLYQKTKGSRKQGTKDQVMRHLPDGQFEFGGLPFARLSDQTLATAQALYPEVSHQAFVTSGRLVTGIGGASVFEVGFTLHHVYGIPYLPASSIKGVTRSWMIQRLFAGSEVKALQDQDFCDLFGCPTEVEDSQKNRHKSYYAIHPESLADNGERQGKIVFFDAYPTQVPKVEEDVMNVHYPKYYQGTTAPTDFQQPVPIAFLAIGAQTPFRFVVATRSSQFPGSSQFKDRTLLDVALEWLGKALQEHGVGAKTAAGYGYLEKI